MDFCLARSSPMWRGPVWAARVFGLPVMMVASTIFGAPYVHCCLDCLQTSRVVSLRYIACNSVLGPLWDFSTFLHVMSQRLEGTAFSCMSSMPSHQCHCLPHHHVCHLTMCHLIVCYIITYQYCRSALCCMSSMPRTSAHTPHRCAPHQHILRHIVTQ